MTAKAFAVGLSRAASVLGFLVLAAVFGISVPVSGADEVPAAAEAPENSPVPANEDAEEEERFLDREVLLPELQRFFQSGPNDIRDIVVVDDGFLVATGAGIIRCRYVDDMPKAGAVYDKRHGLPSGNCYLLKRDVDGGIWAHCQGGVGYLAPKADRWRTFTEKNGLAPGYVTSIALSADGSRVWISSTGGLSTAMVKDRVWRVSKKDSLIDILVHPTEDIVWCRQLVLAACMCGRHVVTAQFDLKSGEWRHIPESGNCAHVASTPVCFNAAEGVLWMSGGYDPPLLYDPRKNTTRTWPKQPNWERVKHGNVVVYFDWFGDMVPAAGGETGTWFATNAGLWCFDSKKDRWQGHLRNDDPGCGQALLTRSNDAKTLYWACEGTVAEFDVAGGEWTDLWYVNDESRRDRRHSLTLSPDGRTLWLIGLGRIMIGEPASRKAVILDDTDQPGLSAARFVRFDPSRKLALIATPQGVVGTDYDGKPKFALTRPAPPVLHRVSRFEFAPDGSEVWCLMEDEGGFDMPPVVLHPRQNRWEAILDPRTSGYFYCMTFSNDGKIVWCSRKHEDEEHPELVQRKPGSSRWEPFAGRMPEHWFGVSQLRTSPKGDELWMLNDGDGLLRAKLANGDVTQYVKSHFRRAGGTKCYTLVGDYAHDLAFTSRGRIAVCSAGGGSEDGITRIDLDTGKATSFRTRECCIEKLVASPDERTVWCIFNNSLLWAFDVQTSSWTHKCSTQKGMPLRFIKTLACSPDGEFVWLRGNEGAAVYSVRDKTWKGFVGGKWIAGNDTASLWVTPDGKHVVCGHGRGIALIEIDGSDYTVLSPDADIKYYHVSHLVPVPGTDDYVCSISHPREGGLYYADMGRRRLRKVKDMKDSTVTAMAIGPDGFLWGAVPGSIFCVNPQTGEDRAGLTALEFGEPAFASLRGDTKTDASRVGIAPRRAVKGRVMPRPDRMPRRPSATSLRNKGMVWESTHLPNIATSKDGTTYVTWYAHPKESSPPDRGLPQITDAVLPVGGATEGATGVNVHNGRKWLPPQLLARDEQYCDVRFAWCHENDLHVLIVKSATDRLYHLSYRPATRTWKKVDVLDHGGTAFCAQDGVVHLGYFDRDEPRVCYRLFDGNEWSTPLWFDAKARYEEGLAVAAGRDGEGHVVWRDGRAWVAHASVKDGKADYSRQDFTGRPIAYRDFTVGTSPDGSLIMAYRADLYGSHPDHDYPHIRTWNGRAWSEATVIPFDTGGFDFPAFVGHGNTLLLSWVKGFPVFRVFSVLQPDGAWSYPLPLCSARDDKFRCDHFVTLHSDTQGRVHAAWEVRGEIYTVVVTNLGK